uniref:Anosmin-1 n=1 Tax=Schistosoma haematobium TaxID=6185 RepID=A0A094ZMF2_SCHHA
MKFPVQLRDKCSQLSPGFLYYDECEQACDSDRFYSDCIKMCESGDSPSGWSCLTGCRSLDAALKRRSGDCPEQIGLAIHRIPNLVSVKNDVQNYPSHESSESSQFNLDKPISLPESDNGLKTNMLENSWFTHHSSAINEITSCTVDAECPQKQDKCCQSQCKQALFNKAILPPIPTVRILEEKHPPSFLVSWNNNEIEVSNLSLPTVYVLQVKSYFGPEYDNRMSSPWKTLVVSTLKGAQLSDPAVGWWYQFQVAAVNQWGSLGFDTPSPPVQLTTLQPSPPSPPRDLADELLTLQANGKIRVQIQWNSPATTVLPVTEYRISWGPDSANIDNNHKFTEYPTQFVHTVPSSQTNYQLTNLYPGVLYRIEVIAMSEWGSTQLRSQPNTLFIHTPNVDSIQDHREDSLIANLKKIDANTVQHLKNKKYLNHYDESYSEDHLTHNSGKSDVSFVCNGTSKSLVFKSSLPSDSSINHINIKTAELSVETDVAVFDGHVSSRPLIVRWTPQVCIETVIVTGNNIDETNSFQSEALIANNIDQFTKPSYSQIENAGRRKESLNSNEKYILLNPVKHGVNNHVDGKRFKKPILRHATLQLTNLNFNCRYLIELLSEKQESSKRSDKKIHPVYTSGYNVELSAWLCTPACSTVKLASWIKKPKCLGTTQVLDIITEPKNLSYKQISVTPTISYNISWKSGALVSRSGSYQQLTTQEIYSDKTSKIIFPVHHRIIWGPSRDTAMKSVVWKSWPNLRPRIDHTRAETKVLRNSETSIVLDNLLPNTLYVVSLQAMTGEHYMPNNDKIYIKSKINNNNNNNVDHMQKIDIKQSLLSFQSMNSKDLHQSKPSTQYLGSSKEVYLVFETPEDSNIFKENRKLIDSSKEFRSSLENGSSNVRQTVKELIHYAVYLALLRIILNYQILNV